MIGWLQPLFHFGLIYFFFLAVINLFHITKYSKWSNRIGNTGKTCKSCTVVGALAYMVGRGERERRGGGKGEKGGMGGWGRPNYVMQYSTVLEQLGIIYTQTHFAFTDYHKWSRIFFNL